MALCTRGTFERTTDGAGACSASLTAAATRGSGTTTSSRVSRQQGSCTTCCARLLQHVYVNAARPHDIKRGSAVSPVGKGRFSYPDGSYFEGELGNGRRVHGQFISGAQSCPQNEALNKAIHNVVVVPRSVVGLLGVTSVLVSHNGVCMHQATAASNTTAAGSRTNIMAKVSWLCVTA